MDPTFPWAHSFLSRVYVERKLTRGGRGTRESYKLDGDPERAKLLRTALLKWLGSVRQRVKATGGHRSGFYFNVGRGN
jgi:hypothetical protein